MLVIRYMALAALVVWVGGIVTLNVLTTPSRDALRQFDLVSIACGALILIALVVMKFVGPPPPAFFPRIGIVAVMLVVAVYGVVSRDVSKLPAMIDAGLGCVLLGWYARE